MHHLIHMHVVVTEWPSCVYVGTTTWDHDVPHGGGSGGGACMCAVMVWFSLNVKSV